MDFTMNDWWGKLRVDVTDTSWMDSALRDVKKFSDKVIYYFFKIWDEVIGHSWWTDTVENVRNTSESLWDDTKKGLTRFRDNTINLFKDVYDNLKIPEVKIPKFHSNSFVDGLIGEPKTLLGKAKKALSYVKDKLPTVHMTEVAGGVKVPVLDMHDLSTKMVKFYADTKEKLISVFHSFPNLLSAAMSGIGLVMVSLLFPPGTIKKVLLAELFTAFAVNSTVVGEQFGAMMTGGSFVTTLGEKIGSAIGLAFATFLRELPKFLNAIGGLMSGFMHGFMAQMPVFGGMFDMLFKVLDATKLGGPLGLIGGMLFGKAALGALKTFGIFKAQIEGIQKSFSGMATIFTGGDKVCEMGVVGRFLYGTVGPARLIALPALIVTAMGGFDAILGNSQLAKYALEGGLLYTTFVGKEGLMRLVPVLQKAASYLGSKFKSLVVHGDTSQRIYDYVFGTGPNGGFKERMMAMGTAIQSSLSKLIVDNVTPYLRKSGDVLVTLLFGENPEATKGKLKQAFAIMGAMIVIAIALGYAFLWVQF
jgi:hypothetical protein